MMMKPNNYITSGLLAVLFSVMTISTAVAASPLTQPKADGLIGEQADGYIGFVEKNVPADVRKLVNEANANRRKGYQSIARKQGTDVTEVEKVGGQKAIEKTLKGNYIRDVNGVWHKK